MTTGRGREEQIEDGEDSVLLHVVSPRRKRSRKNQVQRSIGWAPKHRSVTAIGRIRRAGLGVLFLSLEPYHLLLPRRPSGGGWLDQLSRLSAAADAPFSSGGKTCQCSCNSSSGGRGGSGCDADAACAHWASGKLWPVCPVSRGG
ncbi:hypothetical protein Mapa_008405 [Marchantia paleacea]|nr:hypothetical protein Mapa_008405 [Marchantia paleacea]